MSFNTMFKNRMMENGASASFAEANGSCAHAASMQTANSITMTMDAIILASILISLVLLGACKPYLEKLGFSEGYELCLCVGLGYADEEPEAKPRDAGKVKFVD